jgi:hypothetical protein
VEHLSGLLTETPIWRRRARAGLRDALARAEEEVGRHRAAADAARFELARLGRAGEGPADRAQALGLELAAIERRLDRRWGCDRAPVREGQAPERSQPGGDLERGR